MKVYLSYATSDHALAAQIAASLRQAGLEVWDGTAILPGENWAARVGEALQEAQAMVVLLTPEALRSLHVRREIDYALGEKGYSHRLVPVLAANPEQLTDIPWILNTLQPVALPGGDGNAEAFQHIARTLQAAA